MAKISIIIPTRISTYDRIEKFKKVILSLLNQTISKELYEIIIIDDGSDLNLEYELKDFTYKKDIKIILLHQEKKGPAAAKNLGIKEAKEEILFFLGDDTIAKANLLEEHLRMHKDYSDCAVTNPILPPVDSSELTRLVMGDYKNIDEGIKHKIDIKLGFCTACISLNRKWLEQDLFDENFKDAALEDTELGIRLDKKGLKIVFTSKTCVLHEHVYDIQSLISRAKIVGRNKVYLKNKHPAINILVLDISGFKYNIKKIIYKMLFKFSKKILAYMMPKKYARIIYAYNEILGIEEAKRLLLEKKI